MERNEFFAKVYEQRDHGAREIARKKEFKENAKKLAYRSLLDKRHRNEMIEEGVEFKGMKELILPAGFMPNASMLGEESVKTRGSFFGDLSQPWGGKFKVQEHKYRNNVLNLFEMAIELPDASSEEDYGYNSSDYD